MATLQEALNNMPIFEGASDNARRRALLTAGLGMMANQTTGYGEDGPGTANALSAGILGGLTELDRQGDRETATEQQLVENLLSSRQVAAQEQQAEAQMLTAETGQTRAGTEAAAQAEDARQFDAQAELRKAKINLDEAQAEWLRRRHDGSPAASDKITPAMIESSFIESQMENLYRAFPEKYTLANGERNLELLMGQAFLDLHRAMGTAGSENIPLVASGKGDAAQIGENISALQGVLPQPAAQQTITITNQADLDAKKAAGLVKPGDQVIYNGVTYTVD